MNYVTYDNTGKLTGAYEQDLHVEHADCYIEVTADQRASWTAFQANAARDGIELIPPASAPTCAELIARRCSESDALAAGKRDAIVAGTSPAEMASWPIKLAEAVKFTASSNPADAPNLSAEATARGVTLASLAAMVQTNGATLAALEAQIAGANGKHKDALGAMTDSSAVLSYDIATGYPT